MSDKAKLNTILILQGLFVIGLGVAYWKLTPLLDNAQTALDKANTLEDKASKLFG